MNPIDVLVVDDHPIMRSGILDLLGRADDIEVLDDLEDPDRAIQLAKSQSPDVLLLDMEMSGLSGVDLSNQISQWKNAPAILALCSYSNQTYVESLLENGASGYVTKRMDPDLILDSIRGIAREEIQWFISPVSHPVKDVDLTARETDVLRLLAQGNSNEDAARVLGISESTVRKHATHIYRKLGVSSGREAIAWAWESGFMSRGFEDHDRDPSLA